jgi:phosphate starvation-inducible membrane PsiE
MQIAISCFLCPSGNDRLDTKYIKHLGDCEQARSFDICQLVYNHLILGITKTLKFKKVKGRKPKSFEFCSYTLAVSMIIFIVLFNFSSKFHCSFLSLFHFPLFFFAVFAGALSRLP